MTFMKPFLFILLLLFADICFAAIDTIRIPSKITDVTVFFSGAQVTRTADLKVQKGKHFILLDKLPQEINPQSIQIEGISGCTILSVKYQLSYPNETKKSTSEQMIRNKIDTLEMKNKVIKNKLRVFDMEEKLLMDNSLIQKKDGGAAVIDIREAADLYRSRLNEILQDKLTLSTEFENINKKIQEAYSRLNESTSEFRKTYGQITVTLDCEKDISAGLNVKYFIQAAGWTPFYDFRVEDIT